MKKLLLIFLVLTHIYYIYYFRINKEIPHKKYKTNTDPIYTNRYIKKTIKKYSCLYDIDNIVKNSYIIPGLKYTKSLNKGKKETCTSMTPQGLTVTEKYILVSSYCKTKKHNSVIYLIDKETHKFIKEIILPDKSHLSSLSYDPIYKNIWLSSYKKGPLLVKLPLKDLEKNKIIKKYKNTYKVITQRRVSSISYNNQNIYISYFNKNKPAILQKFKLIKGEPKKYNKEFIVPDEALKLDRKVQGIHINKDIYMSISYSINKSKLKILNKDKELLNIYTIMPMSEDIEVFDNKIYILFESASYSYRKRNIDHIDRIITLEED